jgi:hypothetical protein
MTLEENVMSKLLTATAATLGLLALSSGAALADSDDEYVTGRHLRHDAREVNWAAAEVREEQRELAQAHRRLRWAWWHGNNWEARRAAAKVREERRELWDARHKLYTERRDLVEDRHEYFDDHPRYHW